MIVAIADTHAVLWYVFANASLSKRAKTFIEDTAKDGDQIGVSSIR